MLFNSLQFLVFFAVMVVVYFSINRRWRWVLLLTGSYFFYMSWKAEYIVLVMASTLVSYVCALRMPVAPTRRRRKAYLALSLAVNLGVLFAFKYLNFFSLSVRGVLETLSIQFSPPVLNILLPVGISFYTFQALSYTMEVYRGSIEPERHLGIFAVYVSFFPQLVAGPIERPGNLLPQFYQGKGPDFSRFLSGSKLMVWGFFKKLVIADRLAIVVDTVYGHPENYHGLPLVLVTVFFAFQIYCDFSGYSDIAIGAARIMGIDLMRNFRQPYFAKSIQEFWHRWHISLSTWFQDYLYIPLGGSRVCMPRRYLNIIVVFVLSGLWHGADWTFLVWGALHAGYMTAALATRRYRTALSERIGLPSTPRLTAALSIVTTFLLVTVSWVFFRAESISDAATILTNMFSWGSFDGMRGHLAVQWWFVPAGGFFVALLVGVEASIELGVGERLFRKWVVLEWFAYYAALLGILMFGVFSRTQFIYFQF